MSYLGTIYARLLNSLIPAENYGGAEEYWVSYTIGSDSNAGRSVKSPLKTLDAALGRITANKCGVIRLMPGHTETFTAANTCVIDKAGIAIVGYGIGSLMPSFVLGTDVGATISCNVANVLMKGVKIISDIADCAVGVTLGANADGFTMLGCELSDGGLTEELVIGVSIAALCSNVTLVGNTFRTDVSAETGGCASAIKTVGASDNLKVVGNYIHGHYTAAAMDLDQAASASIVVTENLVVQIDTGAGLGIITHADTSGIVANNRVVNLKDTVAGVSGAGCAFAENYCSNALNASGIIKPAVDS